jgi:predicted nicotinamide N-methyase
MDGSMASRPASRPSLWQRARGVIARPTSSDGICLSRRHELLAKLAHIGPLRTDRIALWPSDETVSITHTADFNRLLDNSVYDFTTDYMPNWAEIWPCGVLVAGVIAQNPEPLRGTRVLELGPGVGVTAVAALKAGAELTVADYDKGSLAMTTLNALVQTGREPATVHLNWRNPSREFFRIAGDGWPLVLGADLLYERKDVRPLLALLERIVLPGGELWLGESGREEAQRMVKALRWRKWTGPSERYTSPLPDPNYGTFDTITVHKLRRPRGDGAAS